MNQIKSKKSEIRRLIRQILRTLSIEEKQRQSSIVQKLFIQSEIFKKSKHIGIYSSQNDQEIDTNGILKAILTNYHKSKHVYVPHVIPDKVDSMQFYEIKDLNQLETDLTDDNKYKILQFKSTDHLIEAKPSIFDLIIVPGMAFSVVHESKSNKNILRLGRGKGYYDRYLAQVSNNCTTVALAFNQQVIKNSQVPDMVPTDQFDVRLNKIFYEKLSN